MLYMTYGEDMTSIIVKTDHGQEECIRIQDYCAIVNRSFASVRHLVFEGNAIRKMKHARLGGTIYIPLKELRGYPHTKPGTQKYGQDIYHDIVVDESVDDNTPIVERQLCPCCTYGNPNECALRKAAEEMTL